MKIRINKLDLYAILMICVVLISGTEMISSFYAFNKLPKGFDYMFFRLLTQLNDWLVMLLLLNKADLISKNGNI